MARPIDYPQASLAGSLLLAKAVDDLGGRCPTDLAADKLNKKVSGGYKSLVGAAVKYGLIKSKGGYLETTHLFKHHKLAYSKEEGDKVLQGCLLQPPIFRSIYDRFKGRALPIGHFDKLLVREFGVAEAVSSRVAKYFIDGAKMCGLLGPGSQLLEAGSAIGNQSSNVEASDEVEDAETDPEVNGGFETTSTEVAGPSPQRYTVRISGPGMDSVVAINEEDDLEIVEIMLRKVRRQLNAAKGEVEEKEQEQT
jgi:hypothetical protein